MWHVLSTVRSSSYDIDKDNLMDKVFKIKAKSISLFLFPLKYIYIYIYIFIYIHVVIGEKDRETTFIPTSLFRDYSLYRNIFFSYKMFSARLFACYLCASFCIFVYFF